MSESSNAGQVEYWNTARHWIDDQEGHDAMLEPLGRLAQDALAPRPGERILDIGCGTGATTLALADAVGASGVVVGADISALLLERARERTGPVPSVRFLEADVQGHPFEPSSFDGAYSRFGVMFFADPVTAFANVARALAPGGRLAFVCWQAPERNEWVTLPLKAASRVMDVPSGAATGPGPFSLSDPDATRALLTEAGFTGIEATDVRRDILLGGPGGVETSLAFVRAARFGREVAESAADGGRAAFRAIRAALEGRLTPRGVEIGAAVWVVTARRSRHPGN